MKCHIEYIKQSTVDELFINNCIKYNKHNIEFLLTNFNISDDLYDAGFVAGCEHNILTVKFLTSMIDRKIGKNVLENMFIESTNKGNKRLAHILLSHKSNLILLV
jgi:hypothetical protein